MAFSSALTFPCLANPHRVAHSETRFSFGNVNSNNGSPVLLSLTGNMIGKRSRTPPSLAKLDDKINENSDDAKAAVVNDRHEQLVNMTEMMLGKIRKAQMMLQVESVRAQKQLSHEHFDGYSKDQLVKVTITGLQQPVGIEITEAAMELGAQKLSLLASEAHRDAFVQTMESMKNKVRNLEAWMGIPETPAADVHSAL